MKFHITKEWLERKLAEADDSQVAAGGTNLDDLQKDAEKRTVTPTVFREAHTQLGRVVRFVREQRGWTREQLAELACLELQEIASIETSVGYQPSPRAVIYLADALGLSRARLKELVGFVVSKSDSANDPEMRFAANSKKLDRLSEKEYDAIYELVKLLSEKNGQGR
jgi:transcriptional regulator with XRE-family HTH domain